jgi:hypothetical protein
MSIPGAHGDWEWQFGGWLRGVSPLAAWSLVIFLALGGILLILYLYRRTLRELSPGRRGILTGLRILVLLAVLLCLANPVRVERAERKPAHPRTLAVLVDRSASMDAMDNRAESRLANAVRAWKRHAGELQPQFEAVEYYRFGTALAKAPSLEVAAGPDQPAAGETHLYEALGQTLDTSPAAIVCLTDGLDTTGTSAATVTAQAQQMGVPLDFVPARNRLRPAESLNIREIKTPSTVLRNTSFNASAILEINAAKEEEVPVELWSGSGQLANITLKVRAGTNVLPWTVSVKSGEPGPMPLEFRLGEGVRQEVAASTTQIVAKKGVEILYYQGALQWGYRFLLSALESDPSFTLTSLLNPALNIKMTSAMAGSPAALTDLPEDAAQLKRFQIVILAHVFADQLSARQQQALVQYAKDGGAVFFITPDTASTAAFAGTQIEQMLPVIFATPNQESPEQTAERIFQEHMQAIGGSQSADETVFAGEAIRRRSIADLHPFALPPGSVGGSKLFQPGKALPEYFETAEVRGVKPGAEILAVQPARSPAPSSADPAPTPDDRPTAARVLLARQRFGAGSTAVLTTDLLWRWKLSLPSSSRAAETFWQQLMLSLVPAETGQGLRLLRKGNAYTAMVNRALTLRVEGSGDSKPTLTSVSPHGERKTLALREMAAVGGSAWEADFLPDGEGRWQLDAANPDQAHARLTIPVSAQVRTAETQNLPADVDGMRRLAEATGGVLLGENDGAAFRAPVPENAAGVQADAVPGLGTLEPRHTEALWNTRWLIALLLGVYGVELVTRRLFRLL